MANLKECSEEVKGDKKKRKGQRKRVMIVGELTDRGLKSKERAEKEKDEGAKRSQGKREAAKGRGRRKKE